MDRQQNGQKKKYKKAMIYKTLHRKLKIEQNKLLFRSPVSKRPYGWSNDYCAGLDYWLGQTKGYKIGICYKLEIPRLW